MNILILGGGGFLGQKLARRLAALGALRGTPIASLTLADIAAPPPVDAPFEVACTACDITDPAQVDALVSDRHDVIFLLAAIVSAHAEAEFDTGYAVNLFGVRNVLERARALGSNPVVVFTSSLAVFGGDVPQPIEDWTIPNPQSSYGTQKAMAELLLNDYSRRGFVQGRGLRLPTISVRPGRPNRAASSFMSSILREPLNGESAICPVERDFPHYYLSPRRCVENLVRAAGWDQADLGMQVNMMMPGRTATIGEMLDALTTVAGPEVAARVRFEDQPEIRAIVKNWVHAINPAKALRLGLEADASFEENIRFYIEDDLAPAG